MIMLPSGPRRKWLISFWLTIGLVSGAACGAMLAILIAPGWFGIGGIVALLVAVSGLRRPQVVSRAYQRWRRAARSYCRVVCQVLTGICFCTIFVVARMAGSSLGLARPRKGRTMWVPRTTLAPADYADRPFLSWTVRSGHVWAVGLMPFLILLKIFEPAPEKATTANIYTLF